MVIDSNYELSVAYRVEKHHFRVVPQAYKLSGHLEKRQKELRDRCNYLRADRGCDAGDLVTRLCDEHEVAPVIDIRNVWKDGEETQQVEDKESVVYTYDGQVFCVCPCTGAQRQMPYGGYEKDRKPLKYRYPVRQYGLLSGCKGEQFCPVGQSVRIPIREDRRIFIPVERSSYKWNRLYHKRSAVERIGSRLDVSFGFERHSIRGLAKMRMQCTLECVLWRRVQ